MLHVRVTILETVIFEFSVFSSHCSWNTRSGRKIFPGNHKFNYQRKLPETWLRRNINLCLQAARSGLLSVGIRRSLFQILKLHLRMALCMVRSQATIPASCSPNVTFLTVTYKQWTNYYWTVENHSQMLIIFFFNLKTKMINSIIKIKAWSGRCTSSLQN